MKKPYQSLWIEGTLVTTRRNPQRKVFVHQHKMFYNGKRAQQNGLQSFRILLTPEDIRRRLKMSVKDKSFDRLRHSHDFRLNRLSIVKTKLTEYSFKLIPFDLMLNGDPSIHCTSIIVIIFSISIEQLCILDTTGEDEQLTRMQKSKRFDREYHTEEFRIVWQLIIKQKDEWYPTDINCETRIITDG